MINRVDEALKDLAEMAIKEIEYAKRDDYFSRDFVDAVCTVFSVYYSRFSDGHK